MTGRETSGDALLDLPAGLAQRFETVRFDVLDKLLNYQFTLDQIDSGAPSIGFNGSRTLRGMVYGPDDAARIDPISHRVRPVWVLDDGSEYELGTYLFANPTETEDSYGVIGTVDLVDEMKLLDAGRDSSFGIASPGGSLLAGAQALVDEVGMSDRCSIDALPSSSVSAPLVWRAGVTRRQMLTDIATAGGCFPPYMDRLDFLQIRGVPDVSAATADVTITGDANGRMIANTLKRSSNLTDAPNRYMVIGNASGTAEVVGIYDVPATAPHSFERRGYRVTTVDTVQTVTDAASANAAAYANYINDRSTYRRAEFDMAADPRVDAYQLVDLLGELFVLQSFTLRLGPGGPLHVVGQQVYVP